MCVFVLEVLKNAPKLATRGRSLDKAQGAGEEFMIIDNGLIMGKETNNISNACIWGENEKGPTSHFVIASRNSIFYETCFCTQTNILLCSIIFAYLFAETRLLASIFFQ